MQKKIYLISTATLFLFTVYIFQSLTVDFAGNLFLRREMVTVDSEGKIFLSYKVPYKEPLSLKIKSPQELSFANAYFNNNFLRLQKTVLRGIIYSYYINIPKEFVEPGLNKLEISMRGHSDFAVDVRLSNYIKKVSDNITFFFLDSHIFYAKGVINSVLLLIFGSLFIYLACKVLALSFSLPAGLIYRNIFLSLLPANAIMTFLRYYPAHIEVRVALTPVYFISLEIFIFILSAGILFSRQISKLRSLRISFSFHKFCNIPFFNLKLAVPQIKTYAYPLRAFSLQQVRFIVWIRSKDLSDKCIIIFITLVLLCAVFLVLSSEPVAEHIANIAYFSLVIGVLGKFINILKKDKKKI